MAEVRFSIETKGEAFEWTLHVLECPHDRLLQIEIPEHPAWMRLNLLGTLRKHWLGEQTCDCTVDRALAALDRAMTACWQELTHVERISFYRWPELKRSRPMHYATCEHVRAGEPVAGIMKVRLNLTEPPLPDRDGNIITTDIDGVVELKVCRACKAKTTITASPGYSIGGGPA